MSFASDLEIAPCLGTGPLADRAQALADLSRELGSSPAAGFLRAWCVPYLFDATERVFGSKAEPVAALNDALGRLVAFLRQAAESDIHLLAGPHDGRSGAIGSREVEEITGEHYGRLFESFSTKSFWEEPLALLRQRLERNGIAASVFEGRQVLDAGCGGGRYSAAWRLLGARRVVGVDVSAVGIDDARRRAETSGIGGVEFRVGNVLALPFPDDSFDVVFSNGVLHHTLDWRLGVAELVRVLQPGGLGWLYVIEDPGGLFWDIIEILRVVLRNEPHDRARAALHMLGIPANRVFYMLDHVLVPINLRLKSSEVEQSLRATGAVEVRRLSRGADLDRIERFHRREPLAEVKYGVGENRFVFSKP